MPSALAIKIVDAIVDNLTNRQGLRHQWDNIDVEVQREIRDEWAEIIDVQIVRG